MPRKRIRREIEALRRSRRGRRFVEGHERHRIGNFAIRVVVITLGVVLMLAGALTFWLPGPNFLIVLAGLVLVAGQWRLVAHWLDLGEVALHRLREERWEPYPHKRRILVAAWLSFAALVATLAVTAWRLGWLPGWLPLVD